MTTKYQKQAVMGLLGLGLIASPLLMKLPAQFRAFNTATNIEASEDIERSRIAQKKETADAINKAGVIPSARKLRIRGYLDTPKKNPRIDTSGYLEDETVFVYDASGICVGQIQAREWKWKYRYKNLCTDAPSLN